MGKDWFEREHAEVERLAGVLEPRARTMFAFLRIGEIMRQPLDVFFPHEQPTWGVQNLDWR